MNAYAKYEGMSIIGEYFDEEKSGKNVEEKPDFRKMLCDIESGKDNVDFILVFKLSSLVKDT
jgi:site-specific DNA recombinase